MPIEGLRERLVCAEERVGDTASSLFLPGMPDVDEAVNANVEALTFLGLVSDQVKVRETIESDFSDLTSLGYNGRLHVLPGKDQISYDHLVAGAEGKRPSNVEPVYIYRQLWVPGTEAESYKEAELNRGPVSAVARLALFNADPNTGFDPVLHHLGLSYDQKYKVKGQLTQLEAVEDDNKAFAEMHLGHQLHTLDHRAVSMLTLLDRISGVAPKDQVLSRGYMRIPELGRRSVDGGSYVGDVDSRDGRLVFGRGYGDPLSGLGVGFSMGQKA